MNRAELECIMAVDMTFSVITGRSAGRLATQEVTACQGLLGGASQSSQGLAERIATHVFCFQLFGITSWCDNHLLKYMTRFEPRFPAVLVSRRNVYLITSRILTAGFHHHFQARISLCKTPYQAS